MVPKPVEHLYFEAFTDQEEPVFFRTYAFTSQAIAQHWIDTLLELPNTSVKWLTDTQFLVTHKNGYFMSVKAFRTCDHHNHDDSTPTPLQLTTFYVPRHKTETQQPTEKIKPTYAAPKRHKSQKAPSDPNLITVAQIAAELNMPPNKARQILRKAGETKPPNGWAYTIDSAEHKRIATLLKNG